MRIKCAVILATTKTKTSSKKNNLKSRSVDKLIISWCAKYVLELNLKQEEKCLLFQAKVYCKNAVGLMHLQAAGSIGINSSTKCRVYRTRRVVCTRPTPHSQQQARAFQRWLGVSSLFRQVYIPTVLYSDRSIFRQVVIPTGRNFDRSIFRQVVIPTGLYSDRSIFRQVVIPTGPWRNWD